MGKGSKSRNQSDGPISKRHHKRLTSEIQSIGARSRGLGIRKLHYGTNAQSSTLHRARTTQARLGTQRPGQLLNDDAAGLHGLWMNYS